MDTEKLNELRQIIEDSDNIVFFGGAGVSTESGIPDFRSVDGLYNQKYKYPPETIISHSFYRRNPEEFYRFYKDKMIFADAKPNKAHIKLAELEKQGKLKAVITQNIDGLHQMAGSRNVIELHGSVHRNYCEKCCTAVFCGTTAKNAGPFTAWTPSSLPPASPGAPPAAGTSSPMWCCMRRHLMRTICRGHSSIYPRRIR